MVEYGSTMLNLLIINSSIREERRGGKALAWLERLVKARPEFSVEVWDLKDKPLPLFDDNPTQEVHDFREKLVWADGFIIITPEYNHGYPASLKSALDWAYDEWDKKAVGFVSYSNGRIAGARAVEQLKPVASELGMAPLSDAIHIARIQDALDEEAKAIDPKLDEITPPFFDKLAWWIDALKVARNKSI